MADLKLADLAEAMAEIDIAMLSTKAANGEIAARPMSNNSDVDYDGRSYYFTTADSRMVKEIEERKNVSLAFQDGRELFVAVEGDGEIIRERSAFEEHWTPDLDQWFENGVETEGLVMIEVAAKRIHYWRGEENGEIKL